MSFKGAHVRPEILFMGMRWHLVDPLSTRHVEALLQERSLNVDHLAIHRIPLPGDGVAEFTDTAGFAIKPPTPHGTS